MCWEGQGRTELLEAGTTILGAFEELPFMELGKREGLKEFTIHLYTDGLTETLNTQNEEFGDERFRRYIGQNLCMDPRVFHERFFAELDNFSHGVARRDDVTLLSLRFS